MKHTLSLISKTFHKTTQIALLCSVSIYSASAADDNVSMISGITDTESQYSDDSDKFSSGSSSDRADQEHRKAFAMLLENLEQFKNLASGLSNEKKFMATFSFEVAEALKTTNEFQANFNDVIIDKLSTHKNVSKQNQKSLTNKKNAPRDADKAIKTRNAKIISLNEALSTAKATISDLEQTKQQLAIQLTKLDADLEKEKRAMAHKDLAIQQKRDEYAALEAQMKAASKLSQAEKEQLNAQLELTQQQVKALDKVVEEQNDALEKRQKVISELHKYKKMSQDLQIQLDAVANKMKTLDLEKADLKQALAAAQNEAAASGSKNTALEERIEK